MRVHHTAVKSKVASAKKPVAHRKPAVKGKVRKKGAPRKAVKKVVVVLKH